MFLHDVTESLAHGWALHAEKTFKSFKSFKSWPNNEGF